MTRIMYTGVGNDAPWIYYRSAYIDYREEDEIDTAEAMYIVDTLEGQGFCFSGWCDTSGNFPVYDRDEFNDLMDSVKHIRSMKWRVLGEYGGYFSNIKDARACAREASKIDGEAGIWCTYNMVCYEDYKNGKCVRR